MATVRQLARIASTRLGAGPLDSRAGAERASHLEVARRLRERVKIKHHGSKLVQVTTYPVLFSRNCSMVQEDGGAHAGLHYQFPTLEPEDVVRPQSLTAAALRKGPP